MSGQESNGIGWKQAFKKTLEWCCGGLLERPYDLASCSSQNERSELRGDSLRERECGLRTLRVYVSQEVIPGAANKLRATESIASAYRGRPVCWDSVPIPRAQCPKSGRMPKSPASVIAC